MPHYKLNGQYICERELDTEQIALSTKNNDSIIVKELAVDHDFENVEYFSSFDAARNALIKQNQKSIAYLRNNNDYLSSCADFAGFQRNLRTYNASI